MRAFADVVEQGSFAGAARLQGVAASAITVRLQRLEDHVGAMLLQRSTRRISLTPEGEAFLIRCRNILAEVEDAVEQVTDAGPLRGAIRMTSVNDFGRTRLAPLLDGFQKMRPEVRIELTLSDAVADLIDGGYDLGIRTGPLVDSNLKARLILRGGRSVCASPDYWAEHGKPAHPKDLVTRNCLVLSRGGERQSLWRFQENGAPFEVRVSGNRTANDGGVLREWAIAGAGIILKWDYDVAEDLRAGRLETALDAFRQREVNLYAVHSASRHPPRRVEALIEYLCQRLSGGMNSIKDIDV
ncbi:LysR family transcriptional regulator [Brucella intermedia]|nr:LysR family transcriptional regulator [Brucella intermedia]